MPEKVKFKGFGCQHAVKIQTGFLEGIEVIIQDSCFQEFTYPGTTTTALVLNQIWRSTEGITLRTINGEALDYVEQQFSIGKSKPWDWSADKLKPAKWNYAGVSELCKFNTAFATPLFNACTEFEGGEAWYDQTFNRKETLSAGDFNGLTFLVESQPVFEFDSGGKKTVKKREDKKTGQIYDANEPVVGVLIALPKGKSQATRKVQPPVKRKRAAVPATAEADSDDRVDVTDTNVITALVETYSNFVAGKQPMMIAIFMTKVRAHPLFPVELHAEVSKKLREDSEWADEMGLPVSKGKLLAG